jgi:hypothetical protein
VYKLSPGQGFNPIIFTEKSLVIRGAEDLLQDSQVGDKVVIEIAEMEVGCDSNDRTVWRKLWT